MSHNPSRSHRFTYIVLLLGLVVFFGVGITVRLQADQSARAAAKAALVRIENERRQQREAERRRQEAEEAERRQRLADAAERAQRNGLSIGDVVYAKFTHRGFAAVMDSIFGGGITTITGTVEAFSGSRIRIHVTDMSGSSEAYINDDHVREGSYIWDEANRWTKK